MNFSGRFSFCAITVGCFAFDQLIEVDTYIDLQYFAVTCLSCQLRGQATTLYLTGMVQEYMDNQVNKMGEMFTVFMQKKLWCPTSASFVAHGCPILRQVREIFRWMPGPERGGTFLRSTCETAV